MGHKLAEMSLSMVAPASSAALATAGFTVSTDTRTWGARASTTGTTRARSSASGTGVAPGRLDSPPTSTTSAPWAANSSPWATACSGSRYRPPSENESGVTLSTPITDGRMGPERRRRPAGPGSAAVHELQGLGPGAGVVAEEASHRRGNGQGAGLLHPPHGHAQVLGLHHHEHASRFEHGLQRVGDLGGHALLHLEAPRIGVDQAGQLGQAGEPPILTGDVGHVRPADERDDVVLAQ